MSLFKKISKANHTAITDQSISDISSDHSISETVPPATLIFDIEKRKRFEEHLQSPEDEYWCQACDIYFQKEEDVLTHMQTQEHLDIEATWKVKNPEDAFSSKRYRSGKPSRQELKKQALSERKKLRKMGLLAPAKTGQGLIKEKSNKKFNKDDYFTMKRQKEKKDTRAQGHIKLKTKKTQRVKEDK
ncbi:Zinc-finger double-stranded RNA-binding domain-containing protein [Spironucleus salmonicida]|uniref:Zinc-finger double-stranded RNA-binding domain-containing protein n=1 Tax=Spironucleus salmonicida TaxID=348837 RepID=V6LZN9_9EUKA|nr:Zinc-finger double-stranded RNA-binding domain-containing protein [Spironucleus salmonicida]|eukprot:EST46314.1 Zinc-finger double-stranded RNA-binding domain-containing protein [Spironucleus salmonicida]